MASMSFQVGDLTIQRLIEFDSPFMPALEMLPDLTQAVLDEHRPWLRQNGLDAHDVFVLCFQSYVVRTPHHTILIDTCLGNDKPRPRPEWNHRSGTAYMDALAATGLSVEDIDYVMCTHLHVDHVGWNTRLLDGRWVPTFPKARYIFGQREYEATQALHDESPLPAFVDSVLPVVEAGRAELVGDDFAIGDHVRLLPTPGHTPGHAAFRFGKGRDDAVFMGDLLHVPLQARYPDLSFIRDRDPAQAAATRRSFLETYCDTATLCCTGHFPSPAVGRVRRWCDGFRIDAPAG